MKPITFNGSNSIFGHDQPEYLPLPAQRFDGGIKTCWKASFKEWLRFVFTGKIYVETLTFNKPVQPLKVTA